jgi:GNAT superfamily N-acetyltransferase
MNPSYKIVEVTAENIDEIGLYCSRSKYKEKGYQNKIEWVKKRFKEGLEYHVLLVDEGRKDMAYRGMIEYMPVEKCWRGINAPGYMAIHCLWVIGRHKNKGYGSMLLQRSINSAKEKGMLGVVGIAITKGGWLPKKNIYLKNGFKEYDEILGNFSLYGIKFKDHNPDPMFHQLRPDKLANYGEGFTILSSNQCPYMFGTIENLRTIADEMEKKVTIIKMHEFSEAQLCGLHPYGTFHIIKDGKYLTHLPGGMRDIKKALNALEPIQG